MRIYTEVIFEWDDKQNQLVETSSKSFDYSGPMALLKAGSWETWNTRWYDDAGNVYKMKVRVGKRMVYDRRISKSTDGGQTWEDDWKRNADNTSKSDAHKWFKDRIKLQSTKSKEAHADRQAWEGWWKGPDGFGAGNEPDFEDTALNQKYLDEEEFYPLDEDVEGLSQDQYNALGADDQGMYFLDDEKGTWIKKDETYWTEDERKSEETTIAETSLRRHIEDWERLTDTAATDEFQREVITATQAMKDAETDVRGAFEDYEKFVGRAKEDYLTDIERLSGTEGTLTAEEAKVREDYDTSYDLLMGKTFEDPAGNMLTADEALAAGHITEEEYGEYAGTYRADVRAEEKIKEEGLEDVTVGREEAFKTLREEAGGAIRAAEAEMGAAGFAATGVGRTAREMLAEEIGEEAEDIEAGITEERADITEGFLERTGKIETDKTTALDDLLTTRTRNLNLIKTTKTTAEEDLLEERTEAGEDLPAPWKTATESYQSLLKSYGIGEGLDISPYSDITARAEGALGGLQANIQTLISDTRRIPGMEDWDPFTVAGGFKTQGETMGFGSYFEPLDTGIVEGLFQPTIAEYGYKPGGDLPLYDPDYPLPWEKGKAHRPGSTPGGV